MNRNLKDLNPIVESKTIEWLEACKNVGLDILVTNTYRSMHEQSKLYNKGRTTPGNIVTYAKAGYSYHQHRLAVDFCPMLGGECAWNRTDLFTQAGEIAKSLGFEWGGDWKNKDMPHIQMTFGLSIQDLLHGKKPPREVKHWADGLYKFYNEHIGEMKEKRFDDPLTRAENLALKVSEYKKLHNMED